MLFRSILRATMDTLVLFLWIGLSAPGQAGEFKHHHIHHAIHELKEAKKELIESPHDFGGHREQAIKAIDAAILSLDKLLVAIGEKPVTPDVGPEVYKKYEHHPHLHHALAELREAHQQVKESKFDFGRDREIALRDIDYAMQQIELVLKHHNGKKNAKLPRKMEKVA